MTQKDIALKLNVSQATVSMALKGSPRISQALRDSVRKLVDDCKAVFCRTVRPCGHGRMSCLLHALVSFAAAFDTCHKYAKLVKVCLL